MFRNTSRLSPGVALILLFCFLIHAGKNVYGQKEGNELIDSLKKELSRTQGKDEVEILTAIAFEIRSNNPDSAIYFAREAGRLAEKIGFKIGAANAALATGSALENKGQYDSALYYTRSALAVYDRQIEVEGKQASKDLLAKKIRAHSNTGIIYHDQGNFSASLNEYELALKVAESINEPMSISSMHNNIGVVYKEQGNFADALKSQKLSLGVRKKIGDKKGIADSYQNIGVTMKALGSIPEAILYFDSALQIKNGLNDKKGVADAWNNIGNIYSVTGDNEKAIEAHRRSLKIREEIQDKKGIAASYNNIGIVYTGINNYPEALKNHLSSLKIQEELGNKKGLGNAHLNIGNVYYYLHNYTEAIKQYKLSLKVREEIGDLRGVSSSYCNIGAVYFDIGNYKDALENLTAALKLQNQIGDKEGATIAYTAIGVIYGREKRYADAMEYLTTGLKIAREINDKAGMADANISIAEVYMQQHKKGDALVFLKKGLLLASELGSFELQKKGYEIYAVIDSMTGNYKQAYEHYKLFIQNRDSMQNEEVDRKILQIRMQYDANRKEDSLRAVHENEIAVEREATKGKLRTGAAAGFSVVAFISFAFIIYRRREKNKHKIQLLHTKNEMLELQQETLKAQLNSHFVTDTIAYINEFIENGDNTAASKYALKLSRMVRSMLSDSFERKQVNLREEIEFSENYIELMLLQYPEGHIRYNISIDDGVDPERCLMPPMILQVLVENAIKHGLSEKGGAIEVRIRQQDGVIYCVVEDNGIGRAAAMQKGGQSKKSLGLILIEKRLKLWSALYKTASLDVEDMKDADGKAMGTRVSFSFR